MATQPSTPRRRAIQYPTGDGKPMAETDIHRRDMTDLIETLDAHFAADPDVYVSGNLLLFYEEGNRRKHISPDVMVVRGVPKLPLRLHYLVWQEGKPPDLVIELTSRTTRKEDVEKKFALYRDVLRVREYILFDPLSDYLKPPLQGHQLVEGQYLRIEPIAGRIPSDVLGLHLERVGAELRLFDPATGQRLALPRESAQRADALQRQLDAERQRADALQRQVEAHAQLAELERRRAEALQRQNESLQRQFDAQQRQVDALQRQFDTLQQAMAAELERLGREVEALRGGRDGGA